MLNKRGSILILTLWTLSFLTVMAVFVSYGVRQRATLVKRLDDISSLSMMADGGVRLGMARIQSMFEIGMDTVNWDLGKSAPLEMAYEKAVIKYAITDEESKLNINVAGRVEIERLVMLVLDVSETEAQGIAASIVDWRDADSTLSIPLGSAEDRDYENRQYPYGAKDSNFEVIEELLLVNGITPDIYKRLRPYFTIYGKGKVNVNTASPMVLIGLGLSSELATLIATFRLGEDGDLGTYDDYIFFQTSTVVSQLSKYFHLSESQVVSLSQTVDKYITTEAGNFSISSVASFSYKKFSRSTNCIVDNKGKVLYWRET